MKKHKLKLLEPFCNDVCKGVKNFEVRKNDRGYQCGDLIKFECVDYNGISLNHVINDKVFCVTYVLSGWGIKNGYVVLGIHEFFEGDDYYE